MTNLAPIKTSSNDSVMGIINLLLGGGQTGLSLIGLLFVLPKLNSLYSDFNAQVDRGSMYLPYALILLMGVINMFIGIKLLSKSVSNKSVFLNFGVISAVITAIITILLVALGSASSLGPIYNLTSK